MPFKICYGYSKLFKHTCFQVNAITVEINQPSTIIEVNGCKIGDTILRFAVPILNTVCFMHVYNVLSAGKSV